MTGKARSTFSLTLTCCALLLGTIGRAEELPGHPADAGVPGWRADHHMHLGSPDICKRIGDCLPSNDPPAVFGADAVEALDAANVSRGVVFSSAYLYGLPSLHLDPATVARLVRLENEFTAAEVRRHADRLVGFLSVDPLQPAALDEIRHWRGSPALVGLKLHLTASGVRIQDPDPRNRLAEVVREAAAQGLPMVIHIGGGTFDADDAETFIRTILPAAGRSPVQIAHAAGGFPLAGNNHVEVLGAFAAHISREDPLTAHVLFDLSYVPAPEEGPDVASALRREMYRIGLDRFLFGSDYNVLTPAAQIEAIGRLGLTTQEEAILRENCAAWVCGTL